MLAARPRTRWVLPFIGTGGTGKTKLIEQLVQDALSLNPRDLGLERILVTADLLDFYRTGIHTPIGFMREVARQLDYKAFLLFAQSNQAYIRLSQAPDPDPAKVAEAERKVEESFVSDFKRLTDRGLAVLMLDTFEEARWVGEWVLEKLLPQLIGNAVVVLAGRPPIQLPVALGTEPIRTLKGLTEAEGIEYFRKRGLTARDITDAEISKLVRLAEGRPIYVALASDWVIEGGRAEELTKIPPQEEFGKALVKHLLDVRKEENRAVLYMAVVWRRMERALLARLLEISDADAAKVIGRLIQRTFVKLHRATPDSPLSCLLHDEMRDLVIPYLKQIDPGNAIANDLLRRTIEYYEEALTKEDGREVARGEVLASNLDNRMLQAEWLYYQMALDFEKGYGCVEPLFRHAISIRDLAYSELVLEEVDRFERMGQLQGERLDEHAFRRALLLSRRELFEEALQKWDSLLNAASFPQKLRATTLQLMTEVESYTGRMNEAVKHGEEGVKLYRQLLKRSPGNKELTRELAQTINNLGFAYRQVNQWSRAIKYYEQALQLQADDDKQRARMLNNLGYIYRLMGDLDTAKSYVGMALTIREDLDNHYELGLGYNTLGMIMEDDANIKNAADLYEKAKRQFEEADSRLGLGFVLLNQGRLYRNINEFDQGLQSLQQAQAIFIDYNNVSYLAEVENELGCVYRQLLAPGDAERAAAHFQKSIDLAGQIKDQYCIADNWDDWSLLAYRQKDLEKAREYAQKVMSLLQAQAYPYLKSKVFRTLGDIEYEEAEQSESAGKVQEARRHFRAAFRHYVNACGEAADSVYFPMQGTRVKASHMLTRYGRVLDRLQEQLRRRPVDQMEHWARQAIVWWKKDAKRAREFPELIQRCQVLLNSARYLQKKR